MTEPVKQRGRKRLNEEAILDRLYAYHLYIEEDMSGAEVAEILGRPRTTVVEWAHQVHQGMVMAS